MEIESDEGAKLERPEAAAKAEEGAVAAAKQTSPGREIDLIGFLSSTCRFATSHNTPEPEEFAASLAPRKFQVFATASQFSYLRAQPTPVVKMKAINESRWR